MRKITQQAVAAFLAGQTFNSSNTTVEVAEDRHHCVMKLHGNTIARRENGGLYVCNGGWSSNTTKERLNGIPGVSVHQKNFVWYLNDVEWDGSWRKV